MNTRKLWQLLTLALINLMLVLAAVAGPQKITGVISDDMCKQKHMMPGHTDADCTRACVKAGSRYALVVGDKVYALKGDPKQIGQFAGMRVSVTGEVTKDSLAVQSISEEK